MTASSRFESLSERAPSKPLTLHELELLCEQMSVAFDHARAEVERMEAQLLAARLREHSLLHG